MVVIRFDIIYEYNYIFRIQNNFVLYIRQNVETKDD